uniref:Uncharacterized protein n=1 Tax=Rhizophora mucronata TaxID=61149 RepID=A0A2P2NA66_RHIMU
MQLTITHHYKTKKKNQIPNRQAYQHMLNPNSQ